MKTLHKSMLLLSSALMALQVNTVVAQEEADDIRDIITVTATKREESIQTVGLSITAISGVDLQARGAVELEDYARSIPNFAFGSTDDGILANNTLSVRGIEGLNTTGFYIDDVPLDESINPAVVDVERVEVLRGPQGTLYGARGLGGTIRIITKAPEIGADNGRVHAQVSSTKEGGFNYLVDGAVNYTLSDTMAVRIMGYYQDEDGFIDRIVGPATGPGVVVPAGTPGAIVGDQRLGATGDPVPGPFTIEDVGGKEIVGAQAALRWQPADALTVDAKIMAQRTRLFGFPLTDNVDATPDILSADDLTQESLFLGDVEGGEDEWVQFSLTGSYEAEWGTFTSSTAYFERATNEGEESGEFVSFTLLPLFIGFSPDPVPLSSPIFQELDFRTIVQEARFVSDFAGPFQMTTGVFYQRTDDDESFNPPNFAPGVFDALDAQIAALVDLGVPGLPPTSAVATNGDLIFASNRDTDVKEFGLYGEFSYTLDRLTATFGVRYFDTETSFAQTQTGLAAGGFNPLSTGTQSQDGFNLKGSLEYEVNDNIYLYASATEGFRIGGANASLPNSEALPCVSQANEIGISEPGEFNSDSLWSYEGGAKTTWQNGRSTFNVTGFFVDFDNIQQRILLQCGFSFIANQGAAESKGFEVEATTQPADGLFLSMGAGFTDAEITEAANGGVGGPGDRLQHVPRWTLNGTLDYERPINGYDGFFRADFSHVGDSISRVVDADTPRTRPSYQIVDVRTGVRTDRYEFALFLDNITDERAVYGDNRTLAAEAVGRQRIVTNRPRTIGVDFRANF